MKGFDWKNKIVMVHRQAGKMWGRANVSPADWIEILALQLSLSNNGKKPSLNELRDWLHLRSCRLEKSTLSRLRGIENCAERLDGMRERAIRTIIDEIEFGTCTAYFEGLAYKALKFYIPNGNPNQFQERVTPHGIYQATRFSSAVRNKIIQSAFSFYRNDLSTEHLHGYADVRSIDDTSGLSSVCRYKEVRKIQPEEGAEYKILSNGFWFSMRDGFVLIGASFEIDPDIQESKIKMMDIQHCQFEIHFLDHDNDPNLIMGQKPSMLRKAQKPACAILEMVRVSSMDYSDWPGIESDPRINIGVFDPIGPLEKYTQILDYKKDSEYYHSQVL